MLKFLKVICMSVACLMMLSGCSSKQEKVDPIETNQFVQSETEDKTEKKKSEYTEEETLDLSKAFNGINGCAVLYSPSETGILYIIKIWQSKKYPHIQLLKLFLL